MFLFKTVDEKLDSLGFVKTEDNEYYVSYERKDIRYDFTQVVDLLHKKSGRHIIQSYDRHLGDNKKIGNTCVGLTYQEAKLFCQKMKQKGWN